MAYINIDLSDVDADDLIEALSDKWLDDNDQYRLMEILKVADNEKMKFFISVIDKYSLLELEEMFKDESDRVPKAGKNQLSLEIPTSSPLTTK